MELSDRQKEIILALAACDMNVSEAARSSFAHHNTVMYHIEKIKRDTGLDPRRFYDLVQLVEAVQ